MTHSIPWDNEQSGAELIADLLGGYPVKRDGPGAPPSTHDYDVHLPDGRVVALEITQQVAEEVLAQRAVEAKLDWRFPGLRHDWVVGIREPVDVQPLNEGLRGVLLTLEAEGVDSLVMDLAEPASDLEEELVSLGVRHLCMLDPAPAGGTAIIGSAPAADSTSAELIVSVAADHSGRDDNRTKLSRAEGVAERHLLIWIHADLHQLTAAMAFGVLPEAEVDLSDAVEVVWIATAFETPTIWRCDSAGWHAICRD